MLDFVYNAPTTVYFGKDKEKQVGEITKNYGYNKIMMQYGKSSIKKSGLYDTVMSSLKQNGITVVEVGGVEPNPKLDFVYNAIKIAKDSDVQMILAVGGGSVIDSCKYTALGAVTDNDVWDFAMGKKKPEKALPVGVILTHAAAGSEMSNSAVITNMALNMKKGCSTELNRCKFAIMNPELTCSLSAYQTACGIVDIMSHTMERYFTDCEPTPLTDSIAESLLKSVIVAGKTLMENPKDYNARATIMWASSLSHNGLTGCGRENYLAVHQLEHALSGEYDFVAHGAGLAVLFPAWAKFIYKHNVKRFAQFARNVWGVLQQDETKAAIDGIEKMSEFFKQIGMPSKLADFNIDKEKAERLAELCTYGRTRTVKNYIPLGFEEIKEIFLSC
ncbi:MAG: iron-containing alcohol dehydrogenase [Clostridia bacterium]|nr:iron-containing alcohol dehydrogenase [Clostridia bacterium]